MTLRKLVTPTINLNGNTADDLIEKLMLVRHNIKHLEQAMVAASDVTHGRNFQTHKDAAGIQRLARDAWRDRQVQIDRLYRDIEQLAVDIQAQKLHLYGPNNTDVNPANDDQPWEVSIPEEGDECDQSVLICHANVPGWEVLKLNGGLLEKRIEDAKFLANFLNAYAVTIEVPT